MRLIKKLMIAMVLLLNVFFWSCETIDPAVEGEMTDFTCEGCHTNRNVLDNVISALDLEPHEEAAEAPG